MPDIFGIKTKVDEIKWMVHELYDRLVISEPVIEMVVPTVHVSNI